MRNVLYILLMTAITASAAIILWQSDIPASTREVQLCERMRFLEFSQENQRWVELSTPIRSVVPCAIPGTTRDLKIEGLKPAFTDKELPGEMVQVDCYKIARMKSGSLPTQMPDGLYCNIPVTVP